MKKMPSKYQGLEWLKANGVIAPKSEKVLKNLLKKGKGHYAVVGNQKKMNLEFLNGLVDWCMGHNAEKTILPTQSSAKVNTFFKSKKYQDCKKVYRGQNATITPFEYKGSSRAIDDGIKDFAKSYDVVFDIRKAQGRPVLYQIFKRHGNGLRPVYQHQLAKKTKKAA